MNTLKNFLTLYPLFVERASLHAISHEFNSLVKNMDTSDMKVNILLTTYDMLIFDHVSVLKATSLMDKEFGTSILYSVKTDDYTDTQLQQHMDIIFNKIAFHIKSIIDVSIKMNAEDITNLSKQIIKFYTHSAKELYTNMDIKKPNPFEDETINDKIIELIDNQNVDQFTNEFEPMMRRFYTALKLENTEKGKDITNKLLFRSVVRGHVVSYILIPLSGLLNKINIEKEEVNKYYMYVVSAFNEFLYSLSVTPDIDGTSNLEYLTSVTTASISLVQSTMIPAEDRKKPEFNIKDNSIALINNIKTWFDGIIQESQDIDNNPWFEEDWENKIETLINNIETKIKEYENKIEAQSTKTP